MNFNPFSTEGLLVLLIVVLLFGSKRLPDTARSIGRSLRIFKAETKGLRDDDKDGFDDITGKPMREPRAVASSADDDSR